MTIFIVECTAEGATNAEAAFSSEEMATNYVLKSLANMRWDLRRNVIGGKPVGCWTSKSGEYGYYIREMIVDDPLP